MINHPDRNDHHDHAHDTPVDHGPVAGPGFSAQIIAVLWLLTGVLVLALLATGRLATYIRTFWHPMTLTVALLVTGLALSVLWFGARHENRAGGEKAKVSPIAWLVFVPFLLVVIGSPSPLGAAMLDNTASGTERDAALAGGAGRAATAPRSGVNFDPLSDTGINELNLDDLHNRYSYGDLEDLAGKKIKVIGFISHGGAASFDDSGEHSAGDGGKVTVNRYKIFCCAADAVAYSATLAGGSDLPDDTWVEVVGTVDVDASDSHLVLTPESITATNEPRIPYL
ncbi:TIGR03943 family protein [Corynebacterium sp. CCM 9203]|uniref:TIGR03943 family putative permease subunit n=1 Tax=Corynebacterium sp. CCM 9203 TaxID=3057615 RepID=UPI003526873C